MNDMRALAAIGIRSQRLHLASLRRMLEEQDKHGLPQLPPLPATRPPTAANAADLAIATGAASVDLAAAAGAGGAAVGELGAAAGVAATSTEGTPLHATAAPPAGSDEEEDIAAVLASARLLTPSAAGEQSPGLCCASLLAYAAGS